MNKLTADDLYTLESYAKMRKDFRSKVIEHKEKRRIALGENVALYFEDRLTMHYQIQEMLRAERIFEEDGIQEELDAYNPLIPDGHNWKATLMIEYADPIERRRQLEMLHGLEDLVWVQIDGHERVYAIADEDLERATEDKTSAVHFLRFELPDADFAAARGGADISIGVKHQYYMASVEPIDPEQRQALAADLD